MARDDEPRRKHPAGSLSGGNKLIVSGSEGRFDILLRVIATTGLLLVSTEASHLSRRRLAEMFSSSFTVTESPILIFPSSFSSGFDYYFYVAIVRKSGLLMRLARILA